MNKRANPGSPHDAMLRFFAAIGHEHGPNGSADEGLPVAADFLGITHWTLRKQIDPDQPSDIGFARVAQLTRHFGATAAAEHLALAAGGVFVPLPSGGGKVSALSAEVMRETGEAIARLFAAAAENSPGGADLTDGEAREALPLVREALATMGDLYAELQAASTRPARR